MSNSARCPFGISGLDQILNGGLIRHHNAIIRGPPGAGKTIFGLHFLSSGIDEGEEGLFINLGEPSTYVRQTAEHFDLNPDEIHFEDLSPSANQFDEAESYSLFSSAEVEQSGYVEDLRSTIEEVEPDRVHIDPITEFRYLTTDEHQFRTQILSLLDFLKEREATVTFTSQAAASLPDDDLQFLTDTVINLEFPTAGRRVSVSKFRGSSFQRGHHGYDISDEGVEVWPKLEPQLNDGPVSDERLSSGVPEIDNMLDGGLDVGSVTFFSGPTGVGKTTTGLQFMKEAAGRGKRCVLYSFEEARRTLLQRSKAVNIPIEDMIESGRLSIVEILPDEYSVDEFGAMVKRDVEEEGADLVMIDGTQGFKQNLRGLDDDPSRDLLRIGRYIRSKGASTIVSNEVHNITGDFQATEGGTSNLADNIVFLRHVEYKGELRKVIGVLKMRTSDFERTLRELEITEHGISVGDPLPEVRGILTGTPEWNDGQAEASSNGP
jgi:circadian clock protein KaiC